MNKTLLIKDEYVSCNYDKLLENFEETIKFESLKFKQKHKNLNYSVSDIEQELRIVLLECFNNYNNNQIHFSTYFHTSIRNFLFNLVRRYSTIKREDGYFETSLDKELIEDGDSLLDIVSSSIDTEDIFLARNIIKILKETADTNIKKDIVKYFFGQKTVKEISDKFDISRQAVYNNIKAYRKELELHIL